MTEATIAEVEARGDQLAPVLSASRLHSRGKTGALFGFCGGAAAIAGGRPEDCQALQRLREAFGCGIPNSG